MREKGRSLQPNQLTNQPYNSKFESTSKKEKANKGIRKNNARTFRTCNGLFWKTLEEYKKIASCNGVIIYHKNNLGCNDRANFKCVE